MPKYNVEVQRVITQTTTIEVSGKDEDAAGERASSMVEKDPAKFEWEDVDTEFDVNSVDEAE